MLSHKILGAFERIDEETCQIVQSEHLEFEAKVAEEFIARWGMVAGAPDGEDSAGRAKLRLQTPEELIERAFNTAALFMEHARKYKLVHVTPDAEEVFRLAKERTKEIEQERRDREDNRRNK